MDTGDFYTDFIREHGSEASDLIQKLSNTGIYDPEINSFEKWEQFYKKLVLMPDSFGKSSRKV